MRNYLHRGERVLLLLALTWMSPGDLLAQSQPLASAQQLIIVPHQNEILSLEKALEQIKQQYQVTFGYRESVINNKTVASDNWQGKSLEETLRQVLSPHGLDYKQLDEVHYVIIPRIERQLQKIKTNPIDTSAKSVIPSKAIPNYASSLASQQHLLEQTITGQVTDLSTGEGLPGVNIVVKGTTVGTVSDIEGNYKLIAPDDAQTLVFSSVGYTTEEVAIENKSIVNLQMAPDIQSLSEIVVVGYGTQEKRDATGAISSVKSEDFNQGVIVSPEQLIQGRSAGVQITNSSGEPGGGMNIRIRGTSSVRSGNNPLFVVDGVPLAGDDVSGGGVDTGFGTSSPRNPLNFLNPNDIASIDILKDASATAIYGSRGANGVVLITTKGGDGAQGTLNYSYNIGVSNITKKYDLLNADEFIDAYAAANGLSPTDQAVLDVDLGADTDWQDEILRTGISQNHNLSFGTSDEKGNYRLSLGYTEQEGIIQESGLRRISGRFNASRNFIDNRLKIGTQITVSDVRDESVPISDNAGELLGGTLKLNPTFSVRNPDGTLFQRGITEVNPVAILELGEDFTNTQRTLANVFLELKILEDLNFRTVLGADRSSSLRKTAYSGDLFAQSIQGQGRYASQDISITNTLIENYFDYNKELSNNIELEAVLGYSYQRFQRSTEVIQAAGFLSSDLNIILNNLAAVDLTQTVNDDGSRVNNGGIVGNTSLRVDALQSVFGRLKLNIRDRYLLTATLRTDGSTRFGDNNRYGYFPSFAAAWRLSDEAFVPDVFDDLKLRVGYGVTGNQEFPSNRYTTRQRFSGESLGVLTGIEFITGNQTAVAFENPDLKWETSTQINLGLDYGFFNNRLRGSLDVYRKNTNDLLFQVISAQPARAEFRWENLDADVINEGIEISIEADAVDNNNFTWSVAANAAFNNNVVRNFAGNVNTGEISGQGLSGAFAQRISNNQPLFAYYLRPFGGFDDAGQTIYPEGDVQQFVGRSPLPTTNLGLTNNFSYRGFDLSIFFTGQLGQYVYNNTRNAFFTAGALAGGSNVTQDVVGNGESRANAPEVSTRFLEDASFVRLQNLTLGYNFDTQNVSFLSNLRLYITGQNLLILTNYSGQDPEVNVNKAIDDVPSFGIDYTPYPAARTLLFGVNVSF